MKNKVIISIIGIIFIACVAGGLWYVTKQQNKASVLRAASSATVQITSNGYVPQTVIIKQGQSVAWINTDTTPHQVSPDPHPTHTSNTELAKTDPLQPQEQMSLQFNKKGRYTYHDENNPLLLKGIIIVE